MIIKCESIGYIKQDLTGYNLLVDVKNPDLKSLAEEVEAEYNISLLTHEALDKMLEK